MSIAGGVQLFIGRVFGAGLQQQGVKNDTTNIGLEPNHQTDESTLTGALGLITFFWRGRRRRRRRRGRRRRRNPSAFTLS